MLTEKYRPKTLLGVIGQDLSNFKRFILEKRNLILYGPTGTGKTSAVYALAKELNYEILEMNASELRNKGVIGSIVGSAMKQQSLFSRSKIVLIDDVDCFYASDRGGVQELVKLIKESAYPVVCTAQDPFGSKLSSLRKVCNLIEFKALSREGIFNYLKEICKLENIDYLASDLYKISENALGDLRAALNDLQMHKDKVLVFEREKKHSVEEALKRVFIKGDINSFNESNVNLDEGMLWLEENIFRQYNRRADIYLAYDKLSKADVFNGRIRRWQYWRFLVYRNFLMTLGIFSSRTKDYLSFKYKKHSRILKYWFAKQKYFKRKAIVAKIAEKTHCSSKRALTDFYLMKHLIKDKSIIKELDLTPEELEWINVKLV